MKRSDTIAAFAAAMAKAQARIRPAVKNAVNPHLRNQYANLESIIEAAREPLAANGFWFIQESGKITAENTITVQTLVIHSSGEWVETECEVPLGKRDAQGLGSASTYGCRYGLRLALGIPTGESDDDGEAAQPKAQPAPKPKPVNEDEWNAFFEALDQDVCNSVLVNKELIEWGQTWRDMDKKLASAVYSKRAGFIEAINKEKEKENAESK